MKKYKLLSKKCVNGHWVSRFLAKKNQECCECLGCKIEIECISDGYVLIIDEDEYYKLKAKREI